MIAHTLVAVTPPMTAEVAFYRLARATWDDLDGDPQTFIRLCATVAHLAVDTSTATEAVATASRLRDAELGEGDFEEVTARYRDLIADDARAELFRYARDAQPIRGAWSE